MIYNRHNRFQPLRNEVNPELPDYSGESLSNRMSAFLDEPEGHAPQTVAETIPKADASPEPKADLEEEVEEDEKFPQLGTTAEIKPDGPAFDEAAIDAETEAETKGMDAKAGEKWKALKARLKETLKENTTLKSSPTKVPAEVEVELADLRVKAAEVEALRQRNAELLKVNDVVAVRESPEFIAAVTAPVDEMERIVVQMAEGASLDANDLFAVITETDIAKQDKMLDQLQAKLGTRMAGRLERLSDDYKAIQKKSSAMLAEAPKHVESSRLARQQEVVAETARKTAAFKSATEASFQTYAKRVPGFTDSSGQLTDLAKATLAKTTAVDPSTLEASDLGYMAFCTEAFPEARRAILRLEKENAILRGSKPAPKPLSGQPSTHKANEDDEQPQGLMERMKGKEFTFSGV
jgi:hypothetical protein